MRFRQDLPFPDLLPQTWTPSRVEARAGKAAGGEEKGEEQQLSRPAAPRPGGSREPASIWTHQAKQLCWVPYVGGARIHDIRAHLVYNEPPPPPPPFLSPPQSVFPLRSSTTCHPSGEPGEMASTFSRSHPAGSPSAPGTRSPVPARRGRIEPCPGRSPAPCSPGAGGALRAPLLLFSRVHGTTPTPDGSETGSCHGCGEEPAVSLRRDARRILISLLYLFYMHPAVFLPLFVVKAVTRPRNSPGKRENFEIPLRRPCVMRRKRRRITSP